jgi:hypothetical protein
LAGYLGRELLSGPFDHVLLVMWLSGGMSAVDGLKKWRPGLKYTSAAFSLLSEQARAVRRGA